MFNNISSKITKAFNSLTGKRIINEDDLNSAMREIRISLLEADVSLSITKEFINNIKEETLNKEVIKGVDPAQMIIKIVNDQLTSLLGSHLSEINLSVKSPATILMVGLQGSGKTTTCGKVANYLYHKKNKKRILLASLDTRRPAAQEQLTVLAKKVGVDALEIIPEQTPQEIAKRASKQAKEQNYDILILDSAGRTVTDNESMDELKELKKLSNTNETILVVDSLIGQDAINVANSFKSNIGLDGVILTRTDGDSRGGVAITMRMATGCPINF